jgi:hypothetical protein
MLFFTTLQFFNQQQSGGWVFGPKCITFWQEIKVLSQITLNHEWCKIVFPKEAHQFFTRRNKQYKCSHSQCSVRFFFSSKPLHFSSAQRQKIYSATGSLASDAEICLNSLFSLPCACDLRQKPWCDCMFVWCFILEHFVVISIGKSHKNT